MEILIAFYSLYGHIYKMAQAAAEGVAQVEGCRAILKRIPETLPDEVVGKMGGQEGQKMMKEIPICTVQDLVKADGILFGTPTRFGNMCGQMRQFLDGTGQLWAKGALVGKVGGVFTSTASQHGGQESTILTFLPTLFHHGMVIVGLPYTFQGQTTMTEVSGGTPYGASTIAGQTNDHFPTENELEGARYQGRHLTAIAKKLQKQ